MLDRQRIKWETKFIYASNKNTVLEMNGVDGDMAKTMDPSLVPSRGIAKFSEVSPDMSMLNLRSCHGRDSVMGLL